MPDRAADWLDAALHYRLWFSETDEHDSVSLPFSLCRRDDLVVVRNVSCGVTDDREIRLFDLEVWVEVGDQAIPPGPLDIVAGLVEGTLGDGVPGHRLMERWECAVVRAGAECGRLSVVPEGMLTRLADMATFRDQDLELETFNRAFEIGTTDRRFASDFLDARMVEFLQARAGGCVVEAVGNRILVAQRATDPPDIDGLIARAVGIAERVPNAVRSLAPALPTAALTPRCPIGPDGRPQAVEPASADDGIWVQDPGGWA